MKRYWLFSYENCYPCGGFQDFMGSFNTIEECDEAQELSDCIEGHIFDSVEQKIVHHYYEETDYGTERNKENPDFKKVFSIK